MNTCKNNTYVDKTDLNVGQFFFMLLGMIPFAIFCPAWIVARFIYIPFYNKTKRELKELGSQPIPFENRYPIQDAKNTKDINSDFSNNIVLSTTPKGLVYMKYDTKNEGFEYWADKDIDYKYLETVARKYVKIFECKDLYIDRLKILKEKLINIKKVIKKNKEREEKINQENNNTSDKNENKEINDVFASLKSYNGKSKVNIKNKTRITKKDIVCDQANKYLKRGKLNEAVFIQPTEKGTNTTTDSMSFSAWKLLNGSY